MAQFTGKKVLVIGGSRGIGAAVVTRFAEEGASVLFTYAGSKDASEQLAARVGATALQSDAGKRDELLSTIRDAGSIDIFIYNAGLLVYGDPRETEPDVVDRMIDVNLRGAYHGAVEAARIMPNGGSILFIGSVNGDRVPFAGIAAYAMTKSGLQGLARGLARDLGAENITVNVVQPGPTDTDMNPANGPLAEVALAPMAIKKHGTSEDVAALIAYLAGEHARGITGAMHTIDGGFGA
jgi:cyclic-di-GMP-binding biofilm dispersal mediator protein